MSRKPRIIISGGGTGGHIFPALSIADKLKQINGDCEILFVGALGKMEMEKVPAAGYKIIGLPVAGLKRSLSLDNLKLPLKVIKSILAARKIVKEFKPDVAVGVGGYASAPLLWTASRMGIPYLIQEQNSFAGLTNRILGKRASAICVAYSEMERFFPKSKILLTGNPVRNNIKKSTQSDKEEAIKQYNLNPSKKTLFVTGGSLGARRLNNCIKQYIIENQSSEYQIIWQYGKIYSAEISAFLNDNQRDYIHASDFIPRMDLAFAAADVIVTRAGAGTISELCIAGKAVIFVPSPNVTEDHQTYNAMSLVKQSAAKIVKDSEAEMTLMKSVESLINNDEEIKKLESNIEKLAMPDAAEVIAKEVLKLVK